MVTKLSSELMTARQINEFGGSTGEALLLVYWTNMLRTAEQCTFRKSSVQGRWKPAACHVRGLPNASA